MLTSVISTLWSPFNVFDFGLTGVFLFLDSIVYWLVAQLFTLYVAVAGVSIDSGLYTKITSNFEVIIGVFALFYLAYALLKALVNPDELQKQTPKTVFNFFISLILLGVVPMIFNYSMQLQNLIISENIIGNLIQGDTEATDIENAGYNLAFTTLETFLTVPSNVEGTLIVDENNEPVIWGDLKKSIVHNKRIENIMAITQWVEPINSSTEGCRYIPIMSTICGCFLAYVILSFCLDMGLRVIKLAFYQIISPIPILLRIIPEKKSVFDNWVKTTVSTWLEVFIRLFIIQIGIFIIDSIIHNPDIVKLNDTTGNVGRFAIIIIALGFTAFLKIAPKEICDKLGIKSEGVKLGIGGKLQASGAYGLAAMVGGGLTAGIRNAFHGVGNVIAADGLGNKFMAAGRGILSTFVGAGSGAVRSARAGFSAKNFKETRNAAGTGARAATTARDNREAYKAAHGNNLLGVYTGHVGDMLDSGIEWAQGGFEAEERRIKHYNDVLDAQDKAKAEAEKLRDKQSNNIALMEEANRRIRWQGNAGALFSTMVDSHGNQMSLEAIRSYVERFSNQDTSRMTANQLRDYNVQVADYRSMLNQLEKGAWQTIESAAFDGSLATTLGLDAAKLSGVKKEVDNMNKMRESAGEAAIIPDSIRNLQNFNTVLTDLETTRNNATAELERKKRAREARQQNSNGNNS